MNQILLLILITILLFFLIRIIATLENRVIQKIRLDAKDKKIEIHEIREPNELDGKSPFSNFAIWSEGSNIFGFSGERLYSKIIVEKSKQGENKYWVQASTAFFIPSVIYWKKITKNEEQD